jgi:hypothetical protein
MHSASIATAQLRAALDVLARALQSADLEALLEAELGLASALASVGRLRVISPPDRAAVRDELVRTRAALVRCRALGGVLGDVAQAVLIAQGRESNYDRAGARPTPNPPSGLRLKARM